ncbi:MAG: ATP synthase F1 subunit gamma [Bacteroidia bacterium]|nr:ATP synthase F1 subunit gamma [Bacteroidia bacterium]
MAGLKEIRVRIGSVRSTRKITSAMKMVSAAKFHRAQDGYSHYQSFLLQFQELMRFALSHGVQPRHSLMVATNVEAPLLVLMFSSNGSLCGGYNASVVQLVRNLLAGRRQAGKATEVWAYGRKGSDLLSRSGVTLGRSDERLVDAPSYESAELLYAELQRDFEAGKYSGVLLAFNRFRSASLQEPDTQQLFPIRVPSFSAEESRREYIFEPSVNDFFAYALPHYARLMLFGALLDNNIGEYGARMSAMTQATDNADTLLDDLVLEYNKARQAAITNELVEIVSGAEALDV